MSGVVCALPWSLKIFVAFLSDVQPICGFRRLPYLTIGLLLQGVGWLGLGLRSHEASLSLIALQQFIVTLGQMTVGVICDSLTVQNARAEQGAAVGALVTATQIGFAAGGLTGTALAGALPELCGASNALMFLIRGISALSLAPLALAVVSEPAWKRPSCRPTQGEEHADHDGAIEVTPRRRCEDARATAKEVWKTARLLAVVRPLLFIFAFAAAPNSTDAFNSYLLQNTPLCMTNSTGGCVGAPVPADGERSGTAVGDFCAAFSNSTSGGGGGGRALPGSCDQQWGGLGFSEATFALIGLLGSLGSVMGNLIYRQCLLRADWHRLFATTVIMASAVSALQLLLMFRSPYDGTTLAERLHMPNVGFALGDDVVVATSNQLLAMPLLVLMARLCPVGAEGTTYGLVSSVQMVGSTVGGILSQIATASFQVTNMDFSALWRLTVLTCFTRLASLLFLPLVPRSAAVVAAAHRDGQRSTAAGALVLGLFFGGLAWAMVQVGRALV